MKDDGRSQRYEKEHGESINKGILEIVEKGEGEGEGSRRKKWRKMKP